MVGGYDCSSLSFMVLVVVIVMVNGYRNQPFDGVNELVNQQT